VPPVSVSRISTWLRPGGWFLATTGHRAWTGTENNWLGGAATYRSWITHTGLIIIQAENFKPEGTSGHTLFLVAARRQPALNTRRDNCLPSPPQQRIRDR
jgi:hypothetical protein